MMYIKLWKKEQQITLKNIIIFILFWKFYENLIFLLILMNFRESWIKRRYFSQLPPIN